jgi:uncharacterized membrane protein
MEIGKFIDGLVKGVLLTGYDFFRLTAAGLFLPFLTRTRRFWPSIIAAEKRLSSLSYLILWIIITISIAFGSSAKVASEIADLADNRGSVFPIIVIALFVAMIVDLFVTFSSRQLRIQKRRRLYIMLARIATANIFFGACVAMLAEPQSPIGPPIGALCNYSPLCGSMTRV